VRERPYIDAFLQTEIILTTIVEKPQYYYRYPTVDILGDIEETEKGD